MKRTPALSPLAILLALTLAAPLARAAEPFAGAQYRYWFFSDDNDLRDVLLYWVPGPFHVQLEVWDFLRGPDQFRPEAGLHLRDSRRSVYDLVWRQEWEQERFWLGTGQVLDRHFVARAEVSPIVPWHGETQWVVDAGLDYYWSDYSFASATVIRDPRQEGLWVFPMRVRLANGRNDWLQATVSPASQRTVGWALDGKLGWVRAGVERNNRYDFTDKDNVILTVGLEFPLPGSWPPSRGPAGAR